MKRSAPLARFDMQLRRNMHYPDMQREALAHVVRFTRSAPGRSMVLYTDRDESNADQAIEEQIAFFKEQQLPWDWKVYEHDMGLSA